VPIARSIKWTFGLTFLLLAGPTGRAFQSADPVQLTVQEDQQRMLGLLHIDSLRRGADGRNTEAPNAANYDESKANPYPKLPDPLTLKERAQGNKACDVVESAPS
jgi:hypothetical protein